MEVYLFFFLKLECLNHKFTTILHSIKKYVNREN